MKAASIKPEDAKQHIPTEPRSDTIPQSFSMKAEAAKQSYEETIKSRYKSASDPWNRYYGE